MTSAKGLDTSGLKEMGWGGGSCQKLLEDIVLALPGGAVPLSLRHFSAYVGFLGDQETAQRKSW